jgi:hypothetical protein
LQTTDDGNFICFLCGAEFSDAYLGQKHFAYCRLTVRKYEPLPSRDKQRIVEKVEKYIRHILPGVLIEPI